MLDNLAQRHFSLLQLKAFIRTIQTYLRKNLPPNTAKPLAMVHAWGTLDPADQGPLFIIKTNRKQLKDAVSNRGFNLRLELVTIKLVLEKVDTCNYKYCSMLNETNSMYSKTVICWHSHSKLEFRK